MKDFVFENNLGQQFTASSVKPTRQSMDDFYNDIVKFWEYKIINIIK